MAIILLLLALLHAYWAIGGHWPARNERALAELVVGTRQMASARAGLSGGSLEEQLLVDSIVRTLTRLPELHAVRFLVDGKQVETLMGHVSTAQPISASD